MSVNMITLHLSYVNISIFSKTMGSDETVLGGMFLVPFQIFVFIVI